MATSTATPLPRRHRLGSIRSEKRERREPSRGTFDLVETHGRSHMARQRLPQRSVSAHRIHNACRPTTLRDRLLLLTSGVGLAQTYTHVHHTHTHTHTHIRTHAHTHPHTHTHTRTHAHTRFHTCTNTPHLYYSWPSSGIEWFGDVLIHVAGEAKGGKEQAHSADVHHLSHPLSNQSYMRQA